MEMQYNLDMFESSGLVPHPPEPAIIVAVKKIPLISTTKRAAFLLYVLSGLIFLVSIVIMYSAVTMRRHTIYTMPDSLKHLQ
jgi:ABC-type uncharacterized transport system permease subunit